MSKFLESIPRYSPAWSQDSTMRVMAYMKLEPMTGSMVDRDE